MGVAYNCPIFDTGDNIEDLDVIEKSIIKRYRKPIWSKFIRAIKNYNLINEGDHIAIAISGGKDSLLLAKLIQELQKHGNKEFKATFLAMDPGYHKQIRKLLEDNCKALNIPLTVFDANVFEVAEKIAGDYPCYMCARMRRGALYGKAKELGCNKLALGHHFNDVVETVIMNILCAGTFKTMVPKLKSKNFPDMELIRPMYYIEEESIIRWMRMTGLMPMNCACMVAAKRVGNKRYEIKDLITELNKKFVNADKNILKATENVNLDALLGWEKDGIKYDYLDED